MIRYLRCDKGPIAIKHSLVPTTLGDTAISRMHLETRGAGHLHSCSDVH